MASWKILILIEILAAGILIAGGEHKRHWFVGDPTSTEVFLPGTGKTCVQADLPDKRYHHTLDTVGTTIVMCGGWRWGGDIIDTSCLQFSQNTGFIIISIPY